MVPSDVWSSGIDFARGLASSSERQVCDQPCGASLEFSGRLFPFYCNGYSSDEQSWRAGDSSCGDRPQRDTRDTERLGQPLVGAVLECTGDVRTAQDERDVVSAILYSVACSWSFATTIARPMTFSRRVQAKINRLRSKCVNGCVLSFSRMCSINRHESVSTPVDIR